MGIVQILNKMSNVFLLLNFLLLTFLTKTSHSIGVYPVIVCTELPQDNGGEWVCDPPVTPGHGYHINTECVFYCDGQAMGVIWCNELARWKPQRPEDFSCDNAPTTTDSTTTVTTSSSTTPSTTTTVYDDSCPFNSKWTSKDHKTRSLYCPRDVCPAVLIESQGLSADQHETSLGCFNYEGSLNNDLYPVYVNQFGHYLIPDEYSNPVWGITRWIVTYDINSQAPSRNSTIRNIYHDDIYCPYDMHDGWQYMDNNTGKWTTDETLKVLCVDPHYWLQPFSSEVLE